MFSLCKFFLRGNILEVLWINYSRPKTILERKKTVHHSGTPQSLIFRANKFLDKNLENAKFLVILVFFGRNVDPDGDHIGGTVSGGTSGNHRVLSSRTKMSI